MRTLYGCKTKFHCLLAIIKSSTNDKIPFYDVNDVFMFSSDIALFTLTQWKYLDKRFVTL